MLAISGERSTGEDVRVQNVTAVAAVANIVKVRKCTYKKVCKRPTRIIIKNVCVYIYTRDSASVYGCGSGYVCICICGMCADRGRYASMLLLFMIGRMNEMK